jgi:hypothetical protein
LKNVKIRIYKTTILPFTLYRCESWSLILREEHRLGVFENRVLRRVFGPKRDEVMGVWKKLHNEELRDLHALPSIIREKSVMDNEMGKACSMNGEKRNACRVMVEKTTRKTMM